MGWQTLGSCQQAAHLSRSSIPNTRLPFHLLFPSFPSSFSPLLLPLSHLFPSSITHSSVFYTELSYTSFYALSRPEFFKSVVFKFAHLAILS